MNVLVTGAAGQVGSELVRLRTPGFEPLGCGRGEFDVTDAAAVARGLDRARPRAVVNCAAYTAVDRAESEEAAAHAANADAPRLLAEACQARDIALVHVSTDYVFDGAAAAPYREDDAVAPLNVYGRSKALGEDAVRGALSRHVILRVSWVFGALGRSFVDTMLRLARERDELAVVDDQVGAPSPALAVAEALRAICLGLAGREDVWGTYHFSTRPALSWCAFAREIVAEAGRLGVIDRVPAVLPITTDGYPTPARRPHNSRLDAGRLREAFDFEPPDWRPYLRDYLAGLAP